MRTLALLAVSVTAASAADWLQFRSAAGVTADAPPTEWARAKKPDPKKANTGDGPADKNVAWFAGLPGAGWAQPVVVGKKVFVATAVTDPPHVPPKEVPKDVTCDWQLLCLDLATGKRLWAEIVAKGKPKHTTHPGNTFATETPCADAERVYCFFGHAGVVAAFDHGGKEVWRTDVAADTVAGVGSGASPTLHADKLFVPLLNNQKSTLLCLDSKTGKELWAADQGKAGASWATPFVWTNSKRTEVIVCGGTAVTSHDPKDGKELWRIGGWENGFPSSPTADGDLLAFGNHRSGANKAPLMAVKAGASGDITPPKEGEPGEFVAFSKPGCSPGMSSPLAAGGLLYVPSGGTLACYDLKTGKQLYKENLKGARQIVASPILAGGHLYLTDEGGKTFVVTPGEEFELVSTNPLDDYVWACPAVADGKLLVRGVKGLYCIGK